MVPGVMAERLVEVLARRGQLASLGGQLGEVEQGAEGEAATRSRGAAVEGQGLLVRLSLEGPRAVRLMEQRLLGADVSHGAGVAGIDQRRRLLEHHPRAFAIADLVEEVEKRGE